MATIEIRRSGRDAMDIFLETAGNFAEDPKMPFMDKIQFRIANDSTDPFTTDDAVDTRTWISFDPDAVTDSDYEAAGRALFGDELYERLLTIWGEGLTGTAGVLVDDSVQERIFRTLMSQPGNFRR